ncbi:MAG: tetratricopeptide repeat protein [Sphingomonadales bacterium]|jgi:tetratricopeptide (TPR) repeat protein
MSRIEQLQLFLKESPEDAFLNYALATEYVGLGDDEKAEGIFRMLLEKHPDYIATYYHLGKLLERKTDKDAAILIYEKGIEKAKKSGERHSLSELQSALLELQYD